MSGDEHLSRSGQFRQRFDPCTARSREYFQETRDWLAEDLTGHPGLPILTRNLELRIDQLQKEYQPIQALDREWWDCLSGIEVGDFADQEQQDQQEYYDKNGVHGRTLGR